MSQAAPLILAVDDDPSLRDLLDDFLGGEGYRVDARDAIAPSEVAALRPDLLLLDLGLDARGPRLDLVEALRANPATAGLPILLVTGAVQNVEQEREHLAALGVGVVLKPFDLEDLLDRVGARLVGAGESGRAT